MDAIFLNGGIQWPMLSRSIGPYKVAHWIRKHGHTCQVIDYVDRMTEDQLVAVIKKFITANTKIIGFSSTFLSNNIYKWKNKASYRIPEHFILAIKRIRKEYPHIKIANGGYMADRVSGWNVVDVSIMSYTAASEDVFLEYLNHLKSGTPPPLGRIILPGMLKGEKVKSRMLYDTAREPKYNIESDDFQFILQDCILPGEPLPLDISRGCIFACKFCQYPHLGKKKMDYVRGMEYLEQEIRYNYEKFGTTGYYLLDDTFNDTEFKVKAFYDMTQRLPFKITFSSYLRADLLYTFPDSALVLQEAGLTGAYHGIESFHPEASKIIGKAWSGKHGKEFLPKLYHDIWKNQVPMHTNFIVGITGDTPQNIIDTVDWYVGNKMHSIQFSNLGLFGPNSKGSRYTMLSEFDKNADKYGYTFTEESKEGFSRWKNDNWTATSSTIAANKANASVSKITKMGSWIIQAALWSGVNKQSVMTTAMDDLDWVTISASSDQKMEQYYNMLMSQ